MLSINCPHIAAGRGVAHDVINGYLVACLAADCLQRSPESVKPQASRFYAMFAMSLLKLVAMASCSVTTGRPFSSTFSSLRTNG